MVKMTENMNDNQSRIYTYYLFYNFYMIVSHIIYVTKIY